MVKRSSGVRTQTCITPRGLRLQARNLKALGLRPRRRFGTAITTRVAKKQHKVAKKQQSAKKQKSAPQAVRRFARQPPGECAPKKSPLDLIGKAAWKWWCNKVRVCIQGDVQAGRCYRGRLRDANACATLLLQTYAARGYLELAHDDAGGILPSPMKMKSFSWDAVSFDRIDNDREHFPSPHEDILENVRFVITPMNTSCNIVATHGANTCAVLRKRILADRGRAWNPPSIYKACKSYEGAVYRDKKRYGAGNLAVEDAIGVFFSQNGRCSISGIVFDASGPFQPSLDAIDPTQPHTRDNIRYVCRFLNACDHSRMSQADPRAFAWTRERFLQYVGLPHLGLEQRSLEAARAWVQTRLVQVR